MRCSLPGKSADGRSILHDARTRYAERKTAHKRYCWEFAQQQKINFFKIQKLNKMKKLILGFFILAMAGVETNAQTLTGTQTADSVKLLSSNCYTLQGCYVVPSGKVLTIEAGTVIRCESGSNNGIM